MFVDGAMLEILDIAPLIPWKIIQQIKRIYTFTYTHTRTHFFKALLNFPS